MAGRAVKLKEYRLSINNVKEWQAELNSPLLLAVEVFSSSFGACQVILPSINSIMQQLGGEAEAEKKIKWLTVCVSKLEEEERHMAEDENKKQAEIVMLNKRKSAITVISTENGNNTGENNNADNITFNIDDNITLLPPNIPPIPILSQYPAYDHPRPLWLIIKNKEILYELPSANPPKLWKCVESSVNGVVLSANELNEMELQEEMNTEENKKKRKLKKELELENQRKKEEAEAAAAAEAEKEKLKQKLEPTTGKKEDKVQVITGNYVELIISIKGLNTNNSQTGVIVVSVFDSSSGTLIGKSEKDEKNKNISNIEYKNIFLLNINNSKKYNIKIYDEIAEDNNVLLGESVLELNSELPAQYTSITLPVNNNNALLENTTVQAQLVPIGEMTPVNLKATVNENITNGTVARLYRNKGGKDILLSTSAAASTNTLTIDTLLYSYTLQPNSIVVRLVNTIESNEVTIGEFSIELSDILYSDNNKKEYSIETKENTKLLINVTNDTPTTRPSANTPSSGTLQLLFTPVNLAQSRLVLAVSTSDKSDIVTEVSKITSNELGGFGDLVDVPYSSENDLIVKIYAGEVKDESFIGEIKVNKVSLVEERQKVEKNESTNDIQYRIKKDNTPVGTDESPSCLTIKVTAPKPAAAALETAVPAVAQLQPTEILGNNVEIAAESAGTNESTAVPAGSEGIETIAPATSAPTAEAVEQLLAPVSGVNSEEKPAEAPAVAEEKQPAAASAQSQIPTESAASSS